MENGEIQLIGTPCGQHGPYTFYKAFKYLKNGVKRVVTLGEFFFVKLWMDSDLVCIGELQLLWIDKNSELVLSSLRLYFLPEHTPEGRMDHGEDEVLSISEKVVLRVEDLVTWITVDAEWTWGRLAKSEKDHPNIQSSSTEDMKPLLPLEGSLDMTDIEKEKKLLDENNKGESTSVIVLSYPRYCRYRAAMKAMEGRDKSVSQKVLKALGGFLANDSITRVLFCRETFDYPELEGHELLCNHLAPKLKGRPRGKRKKRRSISPGSESNESESSVSNVFNTSKSKDITDQAGPSTSGSSRRSTRVVENSESKVFMKTLTTFMKAKQTPIGRIPSLGYKELDLHAFYIKVQKLGGYDVVTSNRLWKSIFDDLSGNHSSTSAATVIRRHYERFLLSFERYEKGEEHKPLPVSERRRLKSKQISANTSDADTSESTSRSGNTTPVPSSTNSAQSTPDAKDGHEQKMKPEIKTSTSLRSIRVKPDRLRDNASKDKIKTEPVAEDTTKTDTSIKDEIKVEECKEESKEESKVVSNNLCEKNSEPVTTAVAPVQKPGSPEKSSPVEGKENVPLLNANEANSDSEIVEVPYKAKTPEIIDLESDSYKNISLHCSSILSDVKKKKLDILKEGGLEVTPVRSLQPPVTPTDRRPSVIQQIPPSIQIGSVTVTADKRSMPPPLLNPAKRPGTSKKWSPGTKSTPFTYVNGSSPPKVVQSNSIYAPSEKITYGDPKMLPKYMGKTSSTDVLDLTVKNAPKPSLEIVKIPAPPPAHTPQNLHKNTPQYAPMLDGRKVGSNLEITLVNPSKPQTYPYPQTPSRMYNPKYGQKRSMAEVTPPPKMPRMEENGRSQFPYGYPPKENGNLEISIPQPYSNKPQAAKMAPKQIPNTKMYPQNVPNMYPNFNPGVPGPNTNKNVAGFNNSTLEMFSQIYALQNLYTTNHLAGVPPLLPTPEQLQFYTDLLAHTSRMRLPFPFNHDGLNSASLNNIKKP